MGIRWNRADYCGSRKEFAGCRYPSFTALLRPVTSPNPFQRLRQSLIAHPAIAMAGSLGEHVLILITLVLQRRGHPVIGNNPVVHVIAKDVWIQQIPVAHLHPDAD